MVDLKDFAEFAWEAIKSTTQLPKLLFAGILFCMDAWVLISDIHCYRRCYSKEEGADKPLWTTRIVFSATIALIVGECFDGRGIDTDKTFGPIVMAIFVFGVTALFFWLFGLSTGVMLFVGAAAVLAQMGVILARHDWQTIGVSALIFLIAFLCFLRMEKLKMVVFIAERSSIALFGMVYIGCYFYRAVDKEGYGSFIDASNDVETAFFGKDSSTAFKARASILVVTDLVYLLVVAFLWHSWLSANQARYDVIEVIVAEAAKGNRPVFAPVKVENGSKKTTVKSPLLVNEQKS